MNEQDQFDRADADLEALLRATFASEARVKVSDSRAVPPFPVATSTTLATVHPIRRRWVGLSLVAAVLIAVVTGATVIGTQAMQSRQAPVPAGTSNAPTPSAPPTPTTVPTTSAASTPPASTAASTPPAPTTEQVEFAGVTLTVPTTWNLLTGAPGAPKDPLPEACFSTGRTWEVTGTGTDTCELRVQIGVYPDLSIDVDLPGLYAQGGSICGTATGIPEQTVTADQVTVDGRIAEHRVFTAGCLTGTLTQWTVPTAPLVYFSRATGRTDPDGDAAADAAVRSATLPGPRSERRIVDRGVITSLTATSLQLDRQVLRIGGAGTVDAGEAPIAYPVAADVVITYTDTRSDPFTLTLTVDGLRSLLAGIALGQPLGHTTPALDGATATITTDGTRVTTIDYLNVA